MRALGFEIKKEEALRLIKEFDRDNSGQINFNDFVEIS